MSNQHNNIFLTGVTGAVGSHLLYEFLRKYAEKAYTGQLILLVRPNSKTGDTAYQRVVNLLTSKYRPNYLNQYSLPQLLSYIEVVSCDLGSETLEQQLAKYHSLKNCYVIHSAATTNLSTGEKAHEENYRVNYCGSLNLLNACKSFAVKFTFISTAYSCGVQEGLIPNDYNQLEKTNFRNPYETIKAKLELKLAKECSALSIKYQIIRPAIVCGRLLDAPLNVISNFSVFYAYIKFFYYAKAKGATESVEIACNPDIDIHITPVDYVAKIVVQAFSNDALSVINIAPEKGMNVSKVIDIIIQDIGYTNIEIVEQQGTPKNVMTHLYVKKVGAVFGPYITTSPFEFEVSLLKEILPNVEVPDVATHFSDLLSFAIQHKFTALESIAKQSSEKVLA